MRKLIIIAVLLASASFANSQPYPQHYLGGAASWISGYGLSYKVYINEKFAIEPTAFIYYWEDEDSKDINYSIGGEVHYAVFREKETILYLLAGLSKIYFHDEYTYDRYGSPPGFPITSERQKDIEHIFSFGPGLGFEFILFEKVAVNLELGITYSIFDRSWSGNFGSTSTGKSAHFTGGAGIYYKF